MKRAHCICLFLLSIVLFLVPAASAQWVQTDGPWVQTTGPGSGGVNTLAVGGGILIAGAGTGHIFFMDGGMEWVEADAGLPNPAYVECFASNGSNVYAGTFYDGIYQWAANRSQWVKIGDPGRLRELAVTGTSIIASIHASGVLRSTNNGSNWKWVNSYLPFVYCFLVSGTTIFAGTEAGVFYSPSDGATWTTTVSRMTSQRVTCLAASGMNLFAGTETSGMFRSTDNGIGWTPLSSSPGSIVSLQATGDFLFCLTNEGVFRSSDIGTSWTRLNLGACDAATSLVLIGTNLFAGTSHGVFRSTNYGTDWFPASSGVTRASVTGLAAMSTPDQQGVQRLFATGDGIFLSMDGGDSWVEKTRMPCYFSLTGIAVADTNLYVSSSQTGLMRSVDNGTSWMKIADGFYDGVTVGGKTLFVWNYEGLLASTTGGSSWSLMKPDSSKEVSSVIASGTNILAGVYGYGWRHVVGAGIRFSSDCGASWIATNLDSGYVTEFAVSDTSVFAVADGYITRSTDNGRTWSRTGCDGNVASIAVSGTNIFGAVGGRVFMSTDDGNYWAVSDTGLTLPNISRLLASGGNLYAGTIAGVWRRALSDMMTSVRQATVEMPQKYSLCQNFPNPFNPSTTIRYGLPARSQVSLTVFNTLGQQVAQLINEELEAGYHEVKFDATNLSSGVYFYRIQAGEFVQTKRLLLLR